MTPAQTIKLSTAKATATSFAPGSLSHTVFNDLLDIIAQLDLEVAQAKAGSSPTSEVLASVHADNAALRKRIGDLDREVEDRREKLDTMNQTNIALGKKIEAQEKESAFYGNGGIAGAFELIQACGVPVIVGMLNQGSSINACLRELVDQHKKLEEVYADARRQITDLLAAKGFGATVYRLLDPEELTVEGDEHGYMGNTSPDASGNFNFSQGGRNAWTWIKTSPGLKASRQLVVRRKVADESAALRDEVTRLKAAIAEARKLSVPNLQKALAESDLAQIESILKTYGWPARAEGRTMVEYLSALLTTFTHQGGVIEGLKHRREESPMMAFARAKDQETFAQLVNRLEKVLGRGSVKILASHTANQKYDLLLQPFADLGMKLSGLANTATNDGREITLRATVVD